MAIHTVVNSIAQAQRMQRGIEGRMKEAIHMGFKMAALYQKRYIIRNVPVDQGQLKNSVSIINHGWSHQAGRVTGNFLERGAAAVGGPGGGGQTTSRGIDVHVDAPHAGPMEFGTRAYRPPLRPLVEWARRKGASNPFGLGLYVQNLIATRGLLPHHFVKKSIPGSLRALNRGFKTGLRMIIAKEVARG